MEELLTNLQHPLVLPIASVMGLGIIAYVLSRWSALACKVLALAAAIAVIWTGLAISSLDADQADFRWTWVTLVEATDVDSGIAFTVDLTRTTLGMTVFYGAGAFGVLIVLYSFSAMRGQYWEGKFYTYLIWTLAGTCTVALAGNLLVLLVGWELVTLMLFLMINQGKGDAKAGGAKAYGVLGFADACLLLAIALLAAFGGTDALSLKSGPLDVAEMGATGYVVYLLMMVAALAKAGAIPLHSWIPSIAKNTATPVMAFLPAALDKLLGIYLLAILSLRMFTPSGAMQVVMMIVGAVTILAAVLMAMMQHNLKKLLSFHAVSQVGYMVLGLGTGTMIGAIGGLFHMINHAIYKSNLFLMSGTVGKASGTDEIEKMGGLAKYLPITFLCSAVAAASISGIPPFNGFVSKWLVYQGTLGIANKGLAVALLVVAVFGSALTLASFVKVIYAAFLSAAPADKNYAKNPPRENFCRVAPMVVLALACIVLGLWPATAIDKVLSPGVNEAVGVAEAAPAGTGVATAGGAVVTKDLGIWNPSQATGLIIIGVILGLVCVWIANLGKKVRVVRPFLSGEVAEPGDDRWRVPGTHFYETVQKLPVIGPLLAQGEKGQLDPYNWSAEHGHTFVDLLRAQHTGLLGLYVSWCVVGLIVTLIYLMLGTGV